jgi:uncharacterized protein YprB with RNaseH-like and TPR domain
MKYKWTNEEVEIMEKYFTTAMTRKTLFFKINRINPNRTYKSVMKKIENMQTLGRIKQREQAIKNLRIGYLDIEATNLNADFGYILCWAIKDKHTKTIYKDVIKRADILKFDFDKNVIKSLLNAIKEFDILYAHYGGDRRFDIPFIRSRALKHNLENELPKQMECYIMDTWVIARNKLKLHNNRLDSIARHLGIKMQKTHLDSDIWMRAALGDDKSLKYVLDHNLKDALITQKVHERLESIERPTFTSI